MGLCICILYVPVDPADTDLTGTDFPNAVVINPYQKVPIVFYPFCFALIFSRGIQDLNPASAVHAFRIVFILKAFKAEIPPENTIVNANKSAMAYAVFCLMMLFISLYLLVSLRMTSCTCFIAFVNQFLSLSRKLFLVLIGYCI